ncbi:MAG: hypothetical protein A3I75_06130 [Deltaproteobacteria bacterium RIFCSPLOWO2_02_FULL_50_16]|nr:MAG: hypothetical protein A2053_00375 [Deltaproteobacteria bacterium GWA2_50_8]OGQ30001.1 MAG: hypothetical protein A3B79_06245 [Deltaproteobacteria bacterium RIFCSPHIGHO2_02_FULL_50_15]OGQ55972.1 MAG: hypothetical protein A3I75_06130 [Deltaproteobacteria bacterium RIFCSPLOWO2_02_FULL_50_16]OGQ66422.1 MAG: hypothetical protein A3F89_02665 [Deltaproteobacteria bacterium RIFCSPLOWO2_12_FULL_50_11]
MPRRRKLHLLIIDQSALARNMYTLLFGYSEGYALQYAESIEKLNRLKTHEKPDVLILNSNAIARGASFQRGRVPTLLLCSADRADLKEEYAAMKSLTVVPKPFYPYDLILLVNQMAQIQRKKTKKVIQRQGAQRRGKK